MADYNDEGAVVQGAYGPGNIPTELLKYDKDKAGMLLYLERGTTKLSHMIHKTFGKRDVTSFTPKWFDVNPLDDVFDVLADQTSAADFNKVKMTNAKAIQLQPGCVLASDKLFLSDGATVTAGEYARVWDKDHRMEEQVLVTEEPVMDSAGTGYAYVVVRRGYINSDPTGRIQAEPSYVAAGHMLNGDRLMLMANTQWTGSDAPRGVHKNIEVDSNPLQIMRFAFEEQTEASWEKTFQNESQMEIAQKLVLKRMAYEFEYRCLYNSPVIEKQGNSIRYAMGGLFHYIDPNNYIDYSNGNTQTTMDWMAFQRNVMAPLFELGGSGDKTAFCSIQTFTQLATMLWNKVQITIDEAWSKRFEFNIYSIAGGGGELKLVPSWVYGRNRTRANQMLVLDFGGPYFKVDTLEDLHINRGPGGNGIQLPGQRLKKFEYVATIGMQRRAKPYHAVITGLPPLTTTP